MNVSNRIKIEKRVVRFLVRTMKKHGWIATEVDDSEEVYKCNTTQDVIDNVFAVDEAYIIFHNAELNRSHSAFIVLGNDGWDAICDYGYSHDDNFNTIMETEVNPYTDKLCEQYC